MNIFRLFKLFKFPFGIFYVVLQDDKKASVINLLVVKKT